MPSVLILDFEGTGLLKNETDDPHAQPGIVEVGFVKVDDMKKKPKTLTMLMDPEVHFEEKAQEVTGISEKEVYGKPNFVECFSEITDFVLGCKHLVTFNGSGYDIPLLQHNLRRYNLDAKFPWPPVHWDLMHIATTVLNLQGKTGNKPPTLMELYENLFNEAFDSHHRALNDALATFECAREIHKQGYLPI